MWRIGVNYPLWLGGGSFAGSLQMTISITGSVNNSLSQQHTKAVNVMQDCEAVAGYTFILMNRQVDFECCDGSII